VRGLEGDDEMADISRVIPDSAGAIRLSPGGSCQVVSRFKVTLVCITYEFHEKCHIFGAKKIKTVRLIVTCLLQPVDDNSSWSLRRRQYTL
jgi:hypothetical protein